MIKPLKKLVADQGPNKLLTKRFLIRFLKSLFDRFTVTAEGIDLQMTGEGNLHLRSLATAPVHPFQVEVSGDGLTVTVHPGRVLTIYRDNYGVMQYATMTPTVGGDALTVARNITISGNTKIVLRTEWSGTDSSPIGTWSILATESPQSTPIVRAFGDIEAEDGTLDLVIAEIEDAAVSTQWVNDHLRFSCSFTYVGVDW